jgi:hypothetical protein
VYFLLAHHFPEFRQLYPMEKADIRGKEPAWTVERWVNRQIDFKTA